MLIPSTPVPSTLSIANPKQIAVYTSSSTVIYTVPTNRKFVGYINGGGSVATYYITPSGGTANLVRASSAQISYQSTTPAQIVLVAGTIISGGGTELTIFGVESDL